VYEVRRLSELAMRLEERTSSVAFVEVYDGNLAGVLPWLVETHERYPQTLFMALLDWPAATPEEARAPDPITGRQDVAIVLLEAGASGIIDSPRLLQPALTIARLHERAARPAIPVANSFQSFLEWGLSLLPWQEP
jgi:hypothetical protein